MNAPTLMLLGGVVAFLMTVHWVRSRDMRERYAIGWLFVALLLLLCGMFPNVIMRWAEAAHLSYPSAVLFVSLTAIYCFALFVSVALTHQHRRNVRLLQEVAILNQRLRLLEEAEAGTYDHDAEVPSAKVHVPGKG